MGKITVNHFVNKDLKPILEGNRLKYPVYIQVIVLTKNLKFKSNNRFFEYLEETDLDNIHIQNILKIEANAVNRIVEDLIKNDDPITSKKLSVLTKNLVEAIDANISKIINNEYKANGNFIPNILLTATYKEINEIVTFFNDDAPFHDFSSKLGLLLDSIRIIYHEIEANDYYVFDLFYGKNEEIRNIIQIAGYEENEVSKRMIELQNLATM